MRKLTALLISLLVRLLCVSCTDPGDVTVHSCESVCDICSLCTNENCTEETDVNNNGTESSTQIEVLKKTYGDDVLDNFYPWLQENEEKFVVDFFDDSKLDMTSVDAITLYPEFNAIGSTARINNIKYEDLYINIEMLRKYVSEYKSLDVSGLTLELSFPSIVRLYKADGTYSESEGMSFSLKGISYIKLVGSGELNWIEVKGFAD